jgi:hypothetical protein
MRYAAPAECLGGCLRFRRFLASPDTLLHVCCGQKIRVLGGGGVVATPPPSLNTPSAACVWRPCSSLRPVVCGTLRQPLTPRGWPEPATQIVA